MAATADHSEILFAICSRLTSPDDVMDLELIAPATALAFPAIALQDSHLQLAVTLAVEPKTTSLGISPPMLTV